MDGFPWDGPSRPDDYLHEFVSESKPIDASQRHNEEFWHNQNIELGHHIALAEQRDREAQQVGAKGLLRTFSLSSSKLPCPSCLLSRPSAISCHLICWSTRPGAPFRMDLPERATMTLHEMEGLLSKLQDGGLVPATLACIDRRLGGDKRTVGPDRCMMARIITIIRVKTLSEVLERFSRAVPTGAAQKL